MDQNDEIWFGVNGDASPSRKTFLNELKITGTPSPTIWLHSEAGHNHEAKEESKLFNSDDYRRLDLFGNTLCVACTSQYVN